MSLVTKLCTDSCMRLGSEHLWTPLVTSLRYRYHKDKIERGPLHRLGYKDKILTSGTLPRSSEFKRLPMKEYRPRNPWSEKESLYGRNDYIDILGDDPNLRPTDVCYKVPHWLRGFQGNEFQMLLRKNKSIGQILKEYHPCRYSDMQRRIKYLYEFLNTKKKDYFWKADRSKS